MNTFKGFVLLRQGSTRFFATSPAIRTIIGAPKQIESTQNVQLRGVYLQGNFNDLPNLIFFPQACDIVENWIPFFTDPENNILNYRNVYVLYPRNFGTSDRNSSFVVSEMADDVVRFMYENKISTATLGGHGLGARLALAVGCYHAERVTGVIGLDYAPVDYRYYESYQEMKKYIEILSELKLNQSRGQLEHHLSQAIKCPKWRKVFSQNLKRISQGNFEWNFDMELINENLKSNSSEALGTWNSDFGIWTGRSAFLFPEYSRWVHLSTNTLAMMKVCIKLKGYGKDVFGYQGDENPLNHWIYDDPQAVDVVGQKLTQFITHFDGVHVLLHSRNDIGKVFIPDVKANRKGGQTPYDYSPSHLHHNWRFSNVYEEGKAANSKQIFG